MILLSLVSILITLLFTLVLAKVLYNSSFRKNKLNSTKELVINATIVAFVFFCVCSLIYVFLLNVV
ncbi:hypothetical protein CGC45_07265 [Francisella opportunistica]|uniref:Uncharacterized protein n=1 Tax=Francisella opportunistica TaxID=2016517 RepID=A0A345JSU5_9GAMM|nr:hypothetical protein BBG19_1442 [Francisella sp. MA067296]AXH30391.1 hypothetical protein CGC43_07260 [Francisella opportunistica]AXH32031.1 hypothetical protein CGC44_07235 [Francisella opportunistica]AXH33679.1 hypothetical protein CGC45_07265 [Francisella opportunistica]